MWRSLQFRLGCHGLPIAGRLAGAGRVDKANRVCLQIGLHISNS